MTVINILKFPSQIHIMGIFNQYLGNLKYLTELDPSFEFDEKDSVDREQTTPDDGTGQRKCRNEGQPTAKLFSENRFHRNGQQKAENSVQNIQTRNEGKELFYP